MSAAATAVCVCVQTQSELRLSDEAHGEQHARVQHSVSSDTIQRLQQQFGAEAAADREPLEAHAALEQHVSHVWEKSNEETPTRALTPPAGAFAFPPAARPSSASSRGAGSATGSSAAPTRPTRTPSIPTYFSDSSSAYSASTAFGPQSNASGPGPGCRYHSPERRAAVQYALHQGAAAVPPMFAAAATAYGQHQPRCAFPGRHRGQITNVQLKGMPLLQSAAAIGPRAKFFNPQAVLVAPAPSCAPSLTSTTSGFESGFSGDDQSIVSSTFHPVINQQTAALFHSKQQQINQFMQANVALVEQQQQQQQQQQQLSSGFYPPLPLNQPHAQLINSAGAPVLSKTSLGNYAPITSSFASSSDRITGAVDASRAPTVSVPLWTDIGNARTLAEFGASTAIAPGAGAEPLPSGGSSERGAGRRPHRDKSASLRASAVGPQPGSRRSARQPPDAQAQAAARNHSLFNGPSADPDATLSFASSTSATATATSTATATASLEQQPPIALPAECSDLPRQPFLQTPHMPPPKLPQPQQYDEQMLSVSKKLQQLELQRQQESDGSVWRSARAGKARAAGSLDAGATTSVTPTPMATAEGAGAAPAPTGDERGGGGECTTVLYYVPGEAVPYRTQMAGRAGTLTLAQFKQQLSRRGAFRYFFKRAAEDVEGGVVHDLITDDAAVLPLWEGKLYAKLERD